MNDLDILIGKTIKEVILRRPQFNVAITFKTIEDEQFHFICEGECCSNTWIESVEGIENIVGEEVIGVEEKRIERIEEDPKYDCLQIYNVEIKSNKGCCVIDFRNSSNGYYGGSLEQWYGEEQKYWG